MHIYTQLAREEGGLNAHIELGAGRRKHTCIMAGHEQAEGPSGPLRAASSVRLTFLPPTYIAGALDAPFLLVLRDTRTLAVVPIVFRRRHLLRPGVRWVRVGRDGGARGVGWATDVFCPGVVGVDETKGQLEGIVGG